MRLVSVTLAGFLSFQKETTIEFGEGVNVIVGQNGSGKSSVIAALEYVLCGDVLRLKPSELAALRCNVSANSRTGVVPETFVEVKFDTSDDDIPYGDSNELTIRREIHEKKEILKINGTQVRGSHHLFKARFLHQNFIAKQGTVMELASANGDELLKKIEDASGVTGMKMAMKKILNSIEHTQLQLLRTEEKIGCVSEMMNQILAKKQQRIEYSLAQDAKQAIVYIFHIRQKEKNRSKLETLVKELELKRKEHAQQAQPFQEVLAEQRKCIAELNVQMQNCNAEVIALKERENILTAARSDIFALREQEKATISKLLHRKKSMVISSPFKRSCLDAEYKIVREEYLQLLRTVSADEQKLLELNVEIKTMKEKIRCMTMADCVEEHQNMLESVTMGVEENIRTTETKITRFKENLREVKEEIAIKEKDLEVKVSDVRNFKQAIRHNLLENYRMYSEIRRGSKELRDMCTHHEEVKSTIRQLEEQHEKLYQELLQEFGLDLAETITGTWNTASDLKVQDSEFNDNYFGLILDMIDYEENDRKLVDITADAFLVTCLVSDTVNAEKFCNYANNNLPYAVHCMNMELTDLNEQPCLDEVPPGLFRVSKLIEIDNGSDIFKNFLLAKISGGAVVCKNVKIAQGAFEEHRNVGIICVTRRGLKLSHSGEVAGGFKASSISLLSCYRRWRTTERELNQAKQSNSSLGIDIEKSREQLNHLKSEANKNKSSLSLNNARYDQGKKDQVSLEIDLLCHQRQEEWLIREISDAEARVAEYKSLIKKIRQERINHLSYHADVYDDMVKLQTLAQTLREYQKTRLSHEDNVLTALAELEQARNRVVEEEKAYDVDEILSQSENEIDRKIEECKIHCDTLDEQLLRYEDQIAEASQKVCSAAIILQATEKELLQAENDFKDTVSRIENVDNFSLHLQSRIQTLNELIAKPWIAAWKESEVVRFQHMTETELKRAYIAATKTLSTLPSDSTLLVADDALHDDKTDLCHASGRIRNSLVAAVRLYDSLQKRAPQVLVKFVDKLEQEMQAVFKSVYPSGDIKIVFSSKHSSRVGAKEYDLQEAHEEDLQRLLREGEISGLKVKSSMEEAGRGNYWNTEELSGGQKSIVSLALIFGLQKIQPSPLLIFDEVDSALDVKRRVTLSSMITGLSASQQFICVSFRKELVDAGDKFIKVQFIGSTSAIEEINKENALNIVKATKVRRNMPTSPSNSMMDIDSDQ